LDDDFLAASPNNGLKMFEDSPPETKRGPSTLARGSVEDNEEILDNYSPPKISSITDVSKI